MRYYGCKDKLLKFIEESTKKADLYQGARFVDLFTGTTVVAQHFKKLGYTVIANDNLEFCYALAKIYIELNEYPKFKGLKNLIKDTTGVQKRLELEKPIIIGNESYERVISYLNNLKPIEGFIYANYCPTETTGLRTFFTNENGAKIDAIRTKIQDWRENNLINELEYYYLITALLEAINRVSNVAGTYAACLKNWDSRALKKLTLIPPKIIFSSKRNKAFKRDANELVKEISADILYLDPPYNTRQYITNYFLLELIAEGWFNEKIAVKGKTGLVFNESKKSLYGQKSTAYKVFSDLINNAKAGYILVSYNSEGILTEGQIKRILSKKGEVEISKYDHKRYRSINQDENDPTLVKENLFLVKTNGMKERFNKLDGAKWLQYSFSIWRDVKKNEEEWKLNHPAMFPIALVEKVIDIYTNKKNQVILDPFSGSGSTVIATLKKEGRAIGIDLSKNYIEMTKKRINTVYKEFNKPNRYWLFPDDAINLDKRVKPNSVDLCITSPPYWNILTERRTADNKSIRKYSDSSADLGNIKSYEQFLSTLKKIFKKVYYVLKNGGFCVVVVMDIRKKSKFYPFHFDAISNLQEVGFNLRDIVIWDRQSEYNNLRPLGYPYSFVVNKIHEYILIFEKPKYG
jgi:adenine-specific DNA methylase